MGKGKYYTPEFKNPDCSRVSPPADRSTGCVDGLIAPGAVRPGRGGTLPPLAVGLIQPWSARSRCSLDDRRGCTEWGYHSPDEVLLGGGKRVRRLGFRKATPAAR